MPIGQVVGPFGVKGQLKVEPLTDFEERFDPGVSVWIDQAEYKIKAVQWHKGQARLTLKGIATVEAVETLKWKKVYADASYRPELEEGEFYAGDLIGLTVVDDSGKRLGKVRAVIPAPAQDLLDVDGVLVPMVKEFVKSVDISGDTVVLTPIEGLFDAEESAEPKETKSAKIRASYAKKRKAGVSNDPQSKPKGENA